MKNKITVKCIAILLLLALLGACGADKPPVTPPAGAENPAKDTPVADPLPEPEPEPVPPDIVITIGAAGDNLLHNTLSWDSKTADGYDFRPIYGGIKPFFEGCDLGIINQEVPLDGTAGAYPTLSAPLEAAAALADAGFNVATLANNHITDKGAKAVGTTIEALKESGFIATAGAYADKEAAGQPVVLEVEGVKVGLLSYTYGLNTGAGAGNGWMVDIINETAITEDMQRIRPMCDFLIVSMHWGAEYAKTPSTYQKDYARLLSELGADLIIGSHPHVLQPFRWIDRPDGGQTLCAYSLGNFASGQRDPDRLIGGMMRLDIRFSPEGELIGIDSVEFEGVVTHYEDGNVGFRLYRLDDYTDELAKVHGLRKYDMTVDRAFFVERVAGVQESLNK